MTDSTAPALAAPEKKSFWEDVIDIFFSPADVFRREEHKSVWPPILFVSIACGVIFFFTFSALQPMFDAEFARASAKAIAKNPQVTQEMMDKMRGYSETGTRFGLGIIIAISMFILGCITWLVGKVVGSKQTFHAGLVVAAWAYFPRVIGAVIGGIQGLLMDPAKLTGQASVSLSPARFMNPDTASAMSMALLTRFDLITIWVTVLLGIGMYVTGRVSKQRAFVFAVLIWLVGSLPAIRQGLAG